MTVRIPKKGKVRDEIFKEMEKVKNNDADWKKGRTWSLVYYAGEEINQILQDAYLMFFHNNGLNPMVFPSLKKFETEVVAMAAGILGGNEQATGSMTSGGTESILMAVKTAREWACAEKPQIKNPEMIVPVTVHPAFEKAAHYLSVKPVHISVDNDFRVDMDEVASAINENTILIVGSAPAYPHGVIDPISELAALAMENNILCHVDACLGGFMLPFVRKLGYPVADFDFQVPGVTSISADLHKYGFAAKGASTILYRNGNLRRHQYFTYPDWPGGLFGSPTMTGTRPGGAIAAAWAVLNYLGEEGYLKIADETMKTTRELMGVIESIPELYVMGKPDMSVFAFTSDTLNIYSIGEEMDKRGWRLDNQQLPPSLHMMVTPVHAGIVEQFRTDLTESVQEAITKGPGNIEGMAAMYGMMGSMPQREAVKDFILDFLDQLMQVEN